MSPKVEDDIVEVILLKPFVFSMPAAKGQKLPTELRFTPRVDPEAIKRGDPFKWLPTTISLPRHVAEHPWVKDSFADGAIEDPKVTVERARKEEEAKKEERKRNAKIIKQADEAFRRATGGGAVATKQGQKVEDELNTPVNEINRNRGAAVGSASPSEEELNTPINALKQRPGEVELNTPISERGETADQEE